MPHAEAPHRQGIEAYRQGDFATAEKLLRQALAAAPNDPAYANNLGEALRAQGRFAEAVDCYRRALRADPQHADALNNLGGALQGLGLAEQAEGIYRLLLQTHPGHPAGLYNLGLICMGHGRLDEAATLLEQAIAALGGQAAEAYNALGVVRLRQGNVAGAEDAFTQALTLNAGLPGAHLNLGALLRQQGAWARALAHLDQALALAPASADALNHRGMLAQDMGDVAGAMGYFRQVLQQQPGDALALNNLGLALRQSGERDEAERCFSQALAAAPHFPAAHYNLGLVCQDGGRLTEALGHFDAALRQDGRFVPALDKRVEVLQQLAAWDGLDEATNALLAALEAGSPDVPPFHLFTLTGDPALQLKAARQWSRAHVPVFPRARKGGPRDGGRLRVGYLSGDFNNHPLAYLLVELFEQHDRSRFEIRAYSFGRDDGSAIRRRVAASFEVFRDIRRAPDAEAAAIIAGDGVDILVDLSGYTKDCRPGIAARRPAPVQAAYMGYPGTTGGEAVDYLIADRFVLPAGSAVHYSEKPVWMPHSYWLASGGREVASRPSRQACGLPESGVVLCALNQGIKILPAMFDCWLRLLRRLPGACLWLLESSADATANLRRTAAKAGVEPSRLIFTPKLPMPDYLARFPLADVYLDTFPYNGHTLVSDALWSGVPVVTLAGRGFAARVAGSLLTAVGLPEWIAASAQEYEEKALLLATDAGLRQRLRQHLEAGRGHFPIFDVPAFARQLERAYEHMARHAGEPPQAFEVEP